MAQRPEYLSVQEAAEALRCTKGTVHNHLRNNVLSSTLIVGKRLIPRAEVERLLREGAAQAPAAKPATTATDPRVAALLDSLHPEVRTALIHYAAGREIVTGGAR